MATGERQCPSLSDGFQKEVIVGRDTKHLERTEHSRVDLCLSGQPMCELKHKGECQAEERLRSHLH